jgi:hypothetical protein
MLFGSSLNARIRPENRLLCEPLDAAGNRGSGIWRQQAQVRDLHRNRPDARGFPSVACVAALARFASAACFPAGPEMVKEFPEGVPLNHFHESTKLAGQFRIHE